jgi:hypothetical protein
MLEGPPCILGAALTGWAKENAVAMAKASKSLDEVMPDKKHKLCRRQPRRYVPLFRGKICKTVRKTDDFDWIADAHRDDGKRFFVRADEKLTAFVELELAICACGNFS